VREIRQVRRMCEAVGHPVIKLIRIRFGPLRLADLPPGALRPLIPQELRALRRAVGLA
jgi:23S rRNA pseudouridine2605 synthase